MKFSRPLVAGENFIFKKNKQNKGFASAKKIF